MLLGKTWSQKKEDLTGISEEQYQVNLVYFMKLIIETNITRGIYWTEKAGKRNHLKAELNLKKVYIRG